MISVIVPVYNVEKYLSRCVDSILAQTYTDFELILVDDGSPDNCPAICDEYAERDSRVKVIHQENRGQAAARNHAVTKSTGEWICFVDSDDMIHPQMLELLYEAAISSNANISMCGAVEAEVVPEDFFLSKQIDFSVQDINEDSLLDLYHDGEHRYWVVWGKLLQRGIVEDIPFEEGRIYEDNAVVCRWLYEAKKVANTEHVLYFYTINPEGTSKAKFSIKQLDGLWAINEQLRFYQQLEYMQLYNFVGGQYIRTSARLFRACLDNIGNGSLAYDIRKKMLHFMWHNRGHVKISKHQLIYILEKMHPETMKALRKVLAIFFKREE